MTYRSSHAHALVEPSIDLGEWGSIPVVLDQTIPRGTVVFRSQAEVDAALSAFIDRRHAEAIADDDGITAADYN